MGVVSGLGQDRPRTVVKNRNYLVMLGLTQHRGGNAAEDVSDDAGEDEAAPSADTAKSR